MLLSVNADHLLNLIRWMRLDPEADMEMSLTCQHGHKHTGRIVAVHPEIAAVSLLLPDQMKEEEVHNER